MWTGILREITSPQLCQVISFMNHFLLIFFISICSCFRFLFMCSPSQLLVILTSVATLMTWHRDFVPLVHLNSFVRDTRAVLLHQLTKKNSHHPFRKLPGLPVAATFHPSQKMFFVSTKKFVRVYDLQKAELVKKLESGLREISSISIHPGGRSQVSLIVILRILKSSKESLRTDCTCW